MPTCDKCGARLLEGGSFCPHCGDAVTALDYQTNAVVSVVPQAEITFGYSSSNSYDSAVEVAKRFPSYSISGSGKSVIHKVSAPVTEIQALTTLFDIVGSWKTSSLSIDGESCSKKNLVYFGLGCYAERQRMGCDPAYCWGAFPLLSIVGCKRLEIYNTVLMPFMGFITRGEKEWRVNKALIHDHIARKRNENRFCPIVASTNWELFLSVIPDTIPIDGTKYWLPDPLWADAESVTGLSPSSEFFADHYQKLMPSRLLSQMVEVRRQEELAAKKSKERMEMFEKRCFDDFVPPVSVSIPKQSSKSGCATAFLLAPLYMVIEFARFCCKL